MPDKPYDNATALRAMAADATLNLRPEDRERLRRVAEEVEWQDIEDAPKDGTHVLVCRAETMAVAYWDSDWDEWMVAGVISFRDPVRWRQVTPGEVGS